MDQSPNKSAKTYQYFKFVTITTMGEKRRARRQQEEDKWLQKQKKSIWIQKSKDEAIGSTTTKDNASITANL